MTNCIDCKIKLNKYYLCSKCYHIICLKCMNNHYEEHKINPILTDKEQIIKLRERVEVLERQLESERIYAQTILKLYYNQK